MNTRSTKSVSFSFWISDRVSCSSYNASISQKMANASSSLRFRNREVRRRKQTHIARGGGNEREANLVDSFNWIHRKNSSPFKEREGMIVAKMIFRGSISTFLEESRGLLNAKEKLERKQKRREKIKSESEPLSGFWLWGRWTAQHRDSGGGASGKRGQCWVASVLILLRKGQSTLALVLLNEHFETKRC